MKRYYSCCHLTLRKDRRLWRHRGRGPNLCVFRGNELLSTPTVSTRLRGRGTCCYRSGCEIMLVSRSFFFLLLFFSSVGLLACYLSCQILKRFSQKFKNSSPVLPWPISRVIEMWLSQACSHCGVPKPWVGLHHRWRKISLRPIDYLSCIFLFILGYRVLYVICVEVFFLSVPAICCWYCWCFGYGRDRSVCKSYIDRIIRFMYPHWGFWINSLDLTKRAPLCKR